MFDSLSIKLEKAFQNLKGQGRITEINVANTIKEIRHNLMPVIIVLMPRDLNLKILPNSNPKLRSLKINLVPQIRNYPAQHCSIFCTTDKLAL